MLAAPPLGANPAATGTTECITWPTGQYRAAVRCWSPTGIEIQCCGHGLLSAAALWDKHWGQAGTLEMGHSNVACRREARITWLGFATIECTDTPPPGWLFELMNRQSLRCAHAGGDDGYLISQFPAGTTLQDMAAPGTTLSNYSRRALIVTCEAPPQGLPTGTDFHFRYFAPQYGVPEDSATGSAMRVLARFWQHRGLGDTLTAHQCSAAGGILHSHVREDTTWVGGHVRPEQATHGA